MEREKGFEVCRTVNTNLAMALTNLRQRLVPQRFPVDELVDLSRPP
jgi:hypothetical protein